MPHYQKYVYSGMTHMSYKKLGALVAFLFLSFSAFAAFTPQDIAKNAIYADAKISPEGDRLAIVVVQDGIRNLAVLDMKDFSTVGGMAMRGGNEVGTFYWANNDRLVMEIWRKEPWQSEPQFWGELYAINYDGTNGEIIYGFNVEERQNTRIKRKKSVDGWARVISTMPDNDNEILIASEPMNVDRIGFVQRLSASYDSIASIHRLNVYSGKLYPAKAYAPAPQSDIFTDDSGNLIMATGTNKNDDTLIFRRKGDDWEEISEQFGQAFHPVSLNEDATEVIYLDNFEQDKVGLFRMNLKTGERKEIYTDDVVSLSQVNLTTDKSSAYAIRVDDGMPAYMVFDSAGEEARIFKDLLGALPGYNVNMVSRSADGNLWLIYATSDIDAGTYYLYNKSANSLSQLFANLEHISVNDFSETKPVSFEASDGMKIHGFVTYPVTMKQGQKVPLVTLVHGGPHYVRDLWWFDREVQLLANEGYAVLQVNYRGSGGYGGDYQVAGYKHWGDDIQQDIIDGTRYIISQGHIDKDKVCIMGGSFGGYSAVMSAELAPDLFKCAVANAGVYDLNLALEKGDITEFLTGDAYLEKVLGTDPAQLTAFSPVTHVSKLSGPVLIAHGARDRRVPLEHAERLKSALDKAGKSYEWFVKDSETHGFYDETNRGEYYQKVVNFLSETLK